MKTLKLYRILLSAAFLLVIINCSEREWNNPVDANIYSTVTTSPASEITSNSAILGGNVTSQGGSAVTERGICYGTSQNPTVAGTKIVVGSGIGEFSNTVSGLTANTTYYVRAYATNNAGTAYGNEVYFTTNEAVVVIPTLSTTAITSITDTTASSGGNITSNGGATVTASGVCWSTSPNPVATGSHTNEDVTTGSFTSSISGLTANTTYYVRAYATNSAGTAYGNEVSFTTSMTITAPTVTTSAVTNIVETSATVGGNVTDNGGATVSERGIWYSSTTSSETSGKKLQIGSGTGAFSTSLIGLIADTKYYIVAYATNSAGTTYGNEISFTTTSGGTGETSTLTDSRDGHVYNTIKIDAQWWMAENLAYLPSVSPPSEESDTAFYYYVYDYQGSSVSEAKATANYSTYGVLYNWPASMNGAASSSANPSGVQGVCPTGWHLPSDNEWKQLIDYLGGNNDVGGKLKETGTTHWTSPNTGATNETGFTALPGGQRYFARDFEFIGNYGFWWSSTEKYGTLASIRRLYYGDIRVINNDIHKPSALSVRCIRD